MKTKAFWQGIALPVWKRLRGNKGKIIQAVYLFISRPIDFPDSPATVYYSDSKQAIYAYAHKHRLKGHIKEGILPFNEYEQKSKSTYWIK